MKIEDFSLRKVVIVMLYRPINFAAFSTESLQNATKSRFKVMNIMPQQIVMLEPSTTCIIQANRLEVQRSNIKEDALDTISAIIPEVISGMPVVVPTGLGTNYTASLKLPEGEKADSILRTRFLLNYEQLETKLGGTINGGGVDLSFNTGGINNMLSLKMAENNDSILAVYHIHREIAIIPEGGDIVRMFNREIEALKELIYRL